MFDEKTLKALNNKYLKKNADFMFNPNRVLEGVSTGSIIADSVIGQEGLLLKGRMTEVFGPESSGKTTICYQSIAEALKKGWVGCMFDTEQTFDVDYARALGVEIGEKFRVFQPDDAEESEAILNSLVGIGKDSKPITPLVPDLDFIIIDSIAAWAPRKLMAIENSTGEGQTKGLHAAYWTNFSRKLQIILKKRNIACLLTNQVRNKLQMGGSFQAQAIKDTGIGAGFSQDAGWTTTGGNALRFYMSVRVLMYQVKKLKETRIIRGVETEVDEAHWVEFKNVKNKVSAPFRKARLVLRYGVGTDDIPPLKEYLKANNIITNSGATLMYKSSDGSCDVKEFGSKKFDKAMKDPLVVEDMKKQYLALKAEEDPYAEKDGDIAIFADDEDVVSFEEVDLDETAEEGVEEVEEEEEEDSIRNWSLADLKQLAKDEKIKIVGKVTKTKLLNKLLKIYN